MKWFRKDAFMLLEISETIREIIPFRKVMTPNFHLEFISPRCCKKLFVLCTVSNFKNFSSDH